MTGYTGNAFLNMGFKFGKGYRIGFDAGYFSGDINLQGKTSAYIFNSYVFSKTFFNKRLTLSAVMNNPYSQFFTFRSTTTTPDFHQSNYNQIFYRNFALTIQFQIRQIEQRHQKKPAWALTTMIRKPVNHQRRWYHNANYLTDYFFG